MSPAIRELLVRGLSALRRTTLWWAFGIGVFTAVNAAFWPSLEGSDALSSLGDASGDLLAAFGAQDIASPAGYLDGQMYALMLPLLLSAMAVATASALTSGDEDAGRLELLHALPVSREAVWLTRFVSSALVVVAVGGATAALTVAMLGPFSFDGVGAGRVVAATMACAVLAVFHGAVAYVVGALGRRRGVAVGSAIAVLVMGYVVSFLFPLSDALRGGQRASPWFWALGEQPVTDGVQAGPLLGLVLVTVALVAAGTLLVDRRDIRSA